MRAQLIARGNPKKAPSLERVATVLKSPSLAEGVFASANASQPVGWGWVDFALVKFTLLDFAFARLATLDFSFAISTLLESAFAKSAMLESFVAFFVVDCHALCCDARNDKVAFFEEAGDLDISKDTHPLAPSAREGEILSLREFARSVESWQSIAFWILRATPSV